MRQDDGGRWRQAVRSAVPAFVRSGYWRVRGAAERRRILTGRHYEPGLCGTILRHLQAGQVAVDVGANTGLITALMAHRVGRGGRVFAFEACPDNVPKIGRTLARCGVAEGVEVVPVAVNDGMTASVSLYPGRGESASEWNIVGRDADGRETEAAGSVPAVSLDRWFDAGQRVDLVKIDVEGAESQVLAGMARILEQHRPTLVIELHSLENWQACDRLVGMGYTLADMDGKRLETGRDDWPTHLLATCREAAARAA